MITIPLATVVSYLTRKGVDPVEALEGAPIHMPHIGDGLITFEAPDASWGDGVYLYLGRDAVCPAAMGWAQRLLSAARGPNSDAVWMGTLRVELWTIGCEEADHRWMWHEAVTAGDESFEMTVLPGRTPPTPAARLRAVLEYEMGRP